MTDEEKGLTSAQVEERARDGRINGDVNVKTKSVSRILRDNIFTFFNFLNIALAVLVIIFGELKNAIFIGVIFCNTAIGIFQEIRAKRIIDRLSLISAPKARVIRDGQEQEIPTSEIVLDDIVIFRAGAQAAADCLVLSGECEVNESLITGESDPVFKKQGEKILSGSFVISGEAKAVAVAVGADSFASKITSGAKYVKKTNSKMMNAINTILKGISICILPMMALLLYNGICVTRQGVNRAVTSTVAAVESEQEIAFENRQDVNRAVTSTVAAVIGMIPEGLVLLSSVVLAVSSIRLAQRKTLVQDLYCIETLSRVDVLCLDKTGTITEGSMAVDEVLPLGGSPTELIDEAMTALMCALSDGNPTFNATKEKWSGESGLKAEVALPFSSAKKWSGAYFPNRGSYIMGAGEFILGKDYEQIRAEAEKLSLGGRRVILLANSQECFREKNLPENIKPIALIAITDKIRAEAPDTLRYFAEQGVEVKIISGDNPGTVSAVAAKAGVRNADRYIDASTVKNIGEVVGEYTVFGRVTPDQKLEIVKALKASGHTVGMTGDGVNDVLALKEADCSVAMQSGSEAARNVSNLVLMDSNFASMPKVVEEGRRSINNIERSASLFLSKTVYSLLLALMFIIIRQPFLFEPIQMTLINALCIGAPSFLLALQTNKDLIRGSFITNVMKRAIPNGVTALLSMAAVVVCTALFGFTIPERSTLATYVLAAVSFMVVAFACRPVKPWKIGMLIGLIACFIAGSFILDTFFNMASFTSEMALCCLLISAAALVVIVSLNLLSFAIVKNYQKRKAQKAL